MATDEMAFRMGMLMGGLAAGVACGFGPLGMGFRRRRLTLGIIGFVMCMLIGVAGGFILALPLGLFLSFCIRLVPEGPLNMPTAESMGYTTRNPYTRGNESALGREIDQAFKSAITKVTS